MHPSEPANQESPPADTSRGGEALLEIVDSCSIICIKGSAEHETKFVTFDIESTDTTSREHTKQGEPRSGIEGPQDLLGGGDDEPGTTTGDAEVLVGDNKSRRFKSKLEVSFTKSTIHRYTYNN
ncbi:uncharacterized protein L3040_007425 [Drepanopeziza brunnea f. sp. 'multigermtubi']|uniref:uncharacterized protein n=1 Tax=Drepanopeziza brunnea f. sp. 'multigermtubi' TaxID=698441 RepID=UPI0023914823|nr:hypothetical protein L3040_007425 [Drepanopeziza brunnea f. sp. 'multigermtubi']